MIPIVKLSEVSIEDIKHMAEWLRDSEVNASWYGTDDRGEPLHIGYSPQQLLNPTPEEWEEVFKDETRKIFSIYSPEYGHIGEAQMVVETPLHEAQLFVIIGRKDLWHHHYGSAALVQLLDLTFYTYNLHRAWVDIPEYNQPALRMCEHIGFLLEGHLRGTHLKEGKWYDSIAMGLLADEYARRRQRLISQTTQPAQ